MQEEQVYLAIDIGGSKYIVALVSANGNILCKQRCQWDKLSAEGIVSAVASTAAQLLERFPGIRPKAAGLTIPGLANPKTGLWVDAVFSGVKNLPIGPIFSERFGLPAFVDNDAQACALAEKRFGSCQKTDTFIYITVSNGVGGAIYTKNGLYYGAFGNAGEIGHMVVEENGRPCRCGSRGCLEAYASGPGLVQTYVEYGGSPMIDLSSADGERIARKVYMGREEAAVRAYQTEGRYLGKAIAAACNLINPEKVVIGGGLSLAFDLFGPALIETVRRQIYKTASPNLAIEPTVLKYHGALMGAAAVAARGINEGVGSITTGGF